MHHPSLESHRAHVLEALSRVVWADRRLAQRQVEALVAIGELLGGAEDVASLLVRRHERERELPPLPAVARVQLFAAAAWIAAVDHRDHPQEQLFLAELRRELGLSADVAFQVREFARAVAERGPSVEDARALFRETGQVAA